MTFAREVCSWKAVATSRYPHLSTYCWRVCWHQNWSGCCAEEESSVLLSVIETRFTGHSAAMRRITTFRLTTDRIYDVGKNFMETLDKLNVEENYLARANLQYGWNLPIPETDAWKDFHPWGGQVNARFQRLCKVHSMTFAHRRNRLKTHFS
jgi:hypothetical protein